jgi:hypothetical protein
MSILPEDFVLMLNALIYSGSQMYGRFAIRGACGERRPDAALVFGSETKAAPARPLSARSALLNTQLKIAVVNHHRNYVLTKETRVCLNHPLQR